MNHKPLWAVELDQLHLEGELNNAFGPAFAPSLVNTRHEIAKGQWRFLGTGFLLRDLVNFHNMIALPSCKQEPCQRRVETTSFALAHPYLVTSASFKRKLFRFSGRPMVRLSPAKTTHLFLTVNLVLFASATARKASQPFKSNSAKLWRKK
jgi:hypothetical protein